MKIIETCPKCGANIRNITICTCPPIPMKECTECSWSWKGKPEKVVRVPFEEKRMENDNSIFFNLINDPGE